MNPGSALRLPSSVRRAPAEHHGVNPWNGRFPPGKDRRVPHPWNAQKMSANSVSNDAS